MAKNKKPESRKKLALIGIVCIVISFLVFLRASHTGSLQQYGILIVFLFYGINRLFKALVLSFK